MFSSIIGQWSLREHFLSFCGISLSAYKKCDSHDTLNISIMRLVIMINDRKTITEILIVMISSAYYKEIYQELCKLTRDQMHFIKLLTKPVPSALVWSAVL